MSDLESSTNIEDFTSNVIAANEDWAQRLHQLFPRYFPDPRDKQAPKMVWIGCSDSRIQESNATIALPGTNFVHRNIANQFHLNDDSALSVLAYAVRALDVQHIVVVGHDHCGGVYTALKRATSPNIIGHQHILCDSLFHFIESFPWGHPSEKHGEEPNDAITRWLTPLVNRIKELELPPDEEAALRIATEENVKLQVKNIIQLREEWVHKIATTEYKPIWVHGWIYDFSTGFIRDLGITQEL